MSLIGLLIMIVVFVAVVWGGFYVCDKAGFPVPIRWIWGGVCLVALVYMLLSQFGVGLGALNRPLFR